MITLHARDIYEFGALLAHANRIDPNEVTPKMLLELAQTAHSACMKLNLRLCTIHIREIKARLEIREGDWNQALAAGEEQEKKTRQQIEAALVDIDTFRENVRREMESVALFFSDADKITKYYDNPYWMDDDEVEVRAAFPSAIDEVDEAGKCLALDRNTACVMHLMRVMEVGLKILAGALRVTQQNDWGSYIREIDKELEKRFKTSGARTPDEAFYSEARVWFDAVKRAWRNPTMHIAVTYTPERAEEIATAVRSFMRHLATQLHE